MNYEVIAFVDLKVEEIYAAVELFCSMIDDSTYALFYYNGHAVSGVNAPNKPISEQDVFLSAKDTEMNPKKPLLDQFIWQGILEKRVEDRSPKAAFFIFDCCREKPNEKIAKLMKKTK